MGDTLYVGSCSGYFHAIGRRDGASVWTYDTSFDGAHGQFHGEMLIEGDRIVVGADAEGDGHLYAFDAGTGEVIWKQLAPGGFTARILREGSRVYAMTMSCFVSSWATDARSGAMATWTGTGCCAARSL